MRKLALVIAVVVAALVAPGAAAKSDPQIAGLQVALYRHGHYRGPIDGIAGPQTQRAVAKVQRSLGVPATGVAGKRTRAALGVYGRPLFGARTIARGMVGFDVSVLQFLLAVHGYPTESLNSKFGPVTERQVRRFQRAKGLTVDGVAGRATRAALLEAQKTKARTRSSKSKTHVVRPGESLTGIAAKYGTSVRALASRNRLDPSGFLLIGTRLSVPRPKRTDANAAVRGSLDRWARHYGVDAQLARALAWQESGFQMNVRSSAGAVGVMQVTPVTWTFVQTFVIGERVPRTFDGNVRIGVAYLDYLLREFKGNVRRALGAYYQGPASVRRDGLFKETRRFVANVLALRGRV